MISDGSVRSRWNTAYVKLKIHKKDNEILILFKEALNFTGPINSEKNSNCQYIEITSKKMFNDLSKYGVIQNKTKSCFLPEIDSNLEGYLIRGLMNGDGHYGKTRKRNTLTTGSKRLAEDFLKIGQKYSAIIQCYDEVTKFRLKFAASRNQRFLKKIIENATLYLNRKYQIILSQIS